MFRRLPEAEAGVRAAPVTILIGERRVECRAGDTVASALFAAGELDCRDTPVQGVPRGPFCMMGVCYDCLVTIDGKPNQQACMTVVRSDMRIERQAGARAVAP